MHAAAQTVSYLSPLTYPLHVKRIFPLPDCPPDCPALVVANGDVDPTDNIPYNQTLTVTCNPGFDAATPILTCLEGSAYDATPNCVAGPTYLSSR